MTSHRPTILAFLATLVLSTFLKTSASADPIPVASGSKLLPTIHADTLDGMHVTLPKDASGTPIALVIGFDRSAKAALQTWSHELTKNLGSKAKIYAVIDGSGAPSFVHGMMSKGLQADAPSTQPQHESNILLAFSDKGWREMCPHGGKDVACVVIVDQSGNIVSARRVVFDQSVEKQVLSDVP